MAAPLERDARPEEHRQVVGQVPGTAIVEIEEYGLSGIRPLFQDAGIEPVAIAAGMLFQVRLFRAATAAANRATSCVKPSLAAASSDLRPSSADNGRCNR